MKIILDIDDDAVFLGVTLCVIDHKRGDVGCAQRKYEKDELYDGATKIIKRS